MTYTKIVRGVALFDLVSTLGMAVPGLSVLTLGLFLHLHQSLGLAGEFPVFDPAHHVFVNVTGILVFCWSFARMRVQDRFLTVCDCWARLAVGSCILFHTFAGGMSRVFLAFVVTEFGGAALQLWALRNADRK
jgi:hypothetical protein